MENQEVEKKIMSIVAEDGSIEEVEVILAFEFKDTKKEYVIYTIIVVSNDFIFFFINFYFFHVYTPLIYYSTFV